MQSAKSKEVHMDYTTAFKWNNLQGESPHHTKRHIFTHAAASTSEELHGEKEDLSGALHYPALMLKSIEVEQ